MWFPPDVAAIQLQSTLSGPVWHSLISLITQKTIALPECINSPMAGQREWVWGQLLLMEAKSRDAWKVPRWECGMHIFLVGLLTNSLQQKRGCIEPQMLSFPPSSNVIKASTDPVTGYHIIYSTCSLRLLSKLRYYWNTFGSISARITLHNA